MTPAARALGPGIPWGDPGDIAFVRRPSCAQVARVA